MRYIFVNTVYVKFAGRDKLSKKKMKLKTGEMSYSYDLITSTTFQHHLYICEF